jgi:hypothetical protein
VHNTPSSNGKLQFATIFLKSQALAILATICNYFSQIQALAIPNFPTKKVIFKLSIRCSLQGSFFLSLLCFVGVKMNALELVLGFGSH